MLEASGAPVGSEVWLAAEDPLPDGSTVAIPPSKITNGTEMRFAASATIPANWTTKFNAGYRSNGGAPASEFRLALRVALLVTGNVSQLSATGQSLDSSPAVGACEAVPEESLFQTPTEEALGGFAKLLVVGSINLRS